MDLNTICFLLLGVLITGYAILDGFDLGVGVLHLFTGNTEERRVNVNAIGPVWDGNEVWLLAGGGVLFSVFPAAYATLLSAFYSLFILLLASLIFRAVSLEFRNKVSSAGWQSFWDWSFGLGSLISSLLFGIMIGNIIKGIPVSKDGIFIGNLLSLLNPYSILTGILCLSIFVMHGSIYMTLKGGGIMLKRMQKFASISWIVLVILYTNTIISTLFISPSLIDELRNKQFSWVIVTVLTASIFYLPVAVRRGKYSRAFMASSIMIACTTGLIGLGLFPLLVLSGIDPSYSLTIYNASAGPHTLISLLIIAAFSLPLVIGYTIYIHRVFRGKVIISEESHY
jgi:cytochrome d ubiquinol oxidase subunit II